MSERTLHLKLKGRVQGVGFRWYAADEARRLDLAGWVKNSSDGSVELCARGAADAIADFEKLVVKGPSGAQVSTVDRIEGTPAGQLKRPFSIVRE